MGKKPEDEDEDEVKALAQEDALEIELTEAEKLKLVAEARREVAKEIKAAKAKSFKEMAKLRIQAEAIFRAGTDDAGEDLVDVVVDLASMPKYLILDGKVFHQRKQPYRVKKQVAAVLLDQMDRGWRQEIARLGENVELADQRKKVLGRLGLQFH